MPRGKHDHQLRQFMGILDDRIAIITGAGTGIGEGEAHALAKEGAKVVLVGRTLATLEKVAADIESIGGEAMAMTCDVRKQGDIDHVVTSTIDRFGQIDILINNAQIMAGLGVPLARCTEQDMRDSWESGYLGSWMFMKACFPHMKDRGGRIINTGSPTGHGNMPGFGAYGPTKEAIRSLTRTAAREWGRYNIIVNAISPFAVSATQPTAAKFLDTEEKMEQMLDDQVANGLVIRRPGHVEHDIGRTVVFLCGPDSTMITGCTISCDGGIAMI